MTSTMRRTVRGTAAGLGALAIITGASACGSLLGGGDGGDGEKTTTEEQPAEGDGSDKATEEATTAEEEASGAAEGVASAEESAAAEGETSAEEATTDAAAEGDDAAAGEALSDEDITAASERFVDFIHVLDDGDPVAACAFVVNPATGEPMTGDEATACGDGLAPSMEGLEPGSMDVIDASMIEATDNGDGTVGITMGGTDFPYSMTKGSDGEWYVSVM